MQKIANAARLVNAKRAMREADETERASAADAKPKQEYGNAKAPKNKLH